MDKQITVNVKLDSEEFEKMAKEHLRLPDFISVEREEDGELIALIYPEDKETPVTLKNGYRLREGYSGEPTIVDIDGKIYLADEQDES